MWPICTRWERPSLTGTQAIARTLSRDYNLSATGRAVLMFSRIAKIQQIDCDAAGLHTCPTSICPCLRNASSWATLAQRTSQFGTPPPAYIGSGGNIAVVDYCQQSALVATGFNAVLALSAGQSTTLVEGYFAMPDINFLNLPNSGGGYYVRSYFDPGLARGGKRRRGFVLLTTAAMVFLVLMPAIGLAIDAGMMYLVQSRLYAAVDAASLAGARALARGIDDNAQHSNAETTATTYFNANFPTGYFAITNVRVTNLAATDSTFMRSVTSTASVDLPFIFLRALGLNQTTLRASAKATRRDVNIMIVMDRSKSLADSGACTPLKAPP